MRKQYIAGLAVVVVIVGIQFVPVERSNPEVTGEIDAPAEVAEVLQRSCYDCHSNETTWPWYSRVAPVSWMLAHHVNEGREKLNFSTWDKLNGEKQSEIVHEIWEETSEGEMPLRTYLLLHPSAKLDDAALETLRAWSGGTREE